MSYVLATRRHKLDVHLSSPPAVPHTTCAPLITTTRHITLTTPRGSTHPQAKFEICKSHPSDDDDDGDGVTGDDDDMATGNNGSRCACSFGSLCPASRSGHRRFGSRCALSGDGGRGGAAAHASLIWRGVGPLTWTPARRRQRWRWRRVTTVRAVRRRDAGWSGGVRGGEMSTRSAAATAWRRSRGGSRAVAAHSVTAAAAWRWRGSGGSFAAAAWRRRDGSGSAVAALSATAAAAWRRQLGGGAAARWWRQRGGGCLAAEPRRQQSCGGAQRDCGGSLAMARQRRQLGGGATAAAARWRRSA